MKTRSKKPPASASQKTDPEVAVATPKAKPLGNKVEQPPQVFILPENASQAARIVTIPHPASKTPTRFFVCPERGFYEFTRVAAPKRSCRSWLLAPEKSDSPNNQASAGIDAEPVAEEQVTGDNKNGYVLQTPDLFIATPIDPLFIILGALAGDGKTVGQEYLATSDYVAILSETSAHLRQMLQGRAGEKLSNLLEVRMEAVCDCMDMGDEKLFALSLQKLSKELFIKAQRTAAKGLPTSMEVKFVRQALDVPVLGIRREDSEISMASAAGSSAETSVGQTSQSSETSVTTTSSVETTATSISGHQDPADADIAALLRVRIALQFIQTSYIPTRLRSLMQPYFQDANLTSIDFKPLEERLSHISNLKRQAQALRSISDNISRKRSTAEEDEDIAIKRRKKDEEEEKKKNVSLGVKKLLKADTSGMKKLSSFFMKKS
jgi:hypothetical protein